MTSGDLVDVNIHKKMTHSLADRGEEISKQTGKGVESGSKVSSTEQQSGKSDSGKVSTQKSIVSEGSKVSSSKQQSGSDSGIESTEYSNYHQGRFGSLPRVSVLEDISPKHGLHRGKLSHEILGELDVTLKLLETSKLRDVAKYFMSPRHHPNILECFDTGTLKHDDETKEIFIAMENCHHYSLWKYVASQISKGIPFDSDKYLSYSRQLALVVEFLHRHEIIIGNLSIDMIFLSVDETTIKICDFGPIAEDPGDSSTYRDIFLLGQIFRNLWCYYPYAIFEKPILVPNPTLAGALINLMLSKEPSSRPSAEEVLQHEIFLPIGSKREDSLQRQTKSGDEVVSSSRLPRKTFTQDQTTSTEDLFPGISSLVNSSERLKIDERGVMTKCGNLSGGGIAVSKSIRKVIPLEGDEVDVGGCYVTFPVESFEKATTTTITAEIDTSKWPKGYEVIAPSLDIDAANLQKKVKVKLPTWEVFDSGEIDEVSILHMPKGSTDWVDTGETIPVTDHPYIEFEWKDFSRITASIKPKAKRGRKYRIAGSIHTSSANEVGVALHIDSTLVADYVKEEFKSANPPKQFKLSLNPFVARAGETVKTGIACLETTKLKVRPEASFFELGRKFKRKQHHFVILGDVSEDQLVGMECKILTQNEGGDDEIKDTYCFNFEMSSKKKKPDAGKSLAPLMGDVSVNVQPSLTERSHNTTAKNLLRDNTKMEYSEKNGNSNISSS